MIIQITIRYTHLRRFPMDDFMSDVRGIDGRIICTEGTTCLYIDTPIEYVDRLIKVIQKYNK